MVHSTRLPCPIVLYICFAGQEVQERDGQVDGQRRVEERGGRRHEVPAGPGSHGSIGEACACLCCFVVFDGTTRVPPPPSPCLEQLRTTGLFTRFVVKHKSRPNVTFR